MRTIYTIVGMKHRGPEAVAAVAALKAGEPITLIREPDNKFDPRAIQVWVGHLHVGYIASKMNKDLTERIEARGERFQRPSAVTAIADAAGTTIQSYFGTKGKFNTFDRQPAVEVEEVG